MVPPVRMVVGRESFVGKEAAVGRDVGVADGARRIGGGRLLAFQRQLTRPIAALIERRRAAGLSRRHGGAPDCQLEIEASEPIRVRGDADDLRDLVRNLLESALQHGCGRVSVRARRGGVRPGRIAIEVADEGTGVPAGMEEAAFERFRKLHPDSPGAGLGLAIVRQVARSHGGDARFAPGTGRVIVSLPEAGPDSRIEFQRPGICPDRVDAEPMKHGAPIASAG